MRAGMKYATTGTPSAAGSPYFHRNAPPCPVHSSAPVDTGFVWTGKGEGVPFSLSITGAAKTLTSPIRPAGTGIRKM